MMRWLTVALLLLWPHIALAQSAAPAALPALVNADNRAGIDLSGAWNWSVDPYRDGLAGFHGEEAGPNARRYADVNVAEETARNPTALWEHDLQRSPVTTLPSSWITHDATMRHYDGLGSGLNQHQ